jgi:F-type H+-transporting ATPase subunit b
MDKLLQPDLGLMILTIVTFVALVFILKTAAWGSILGGIKSREEKIRGDIGRAEKAQADAESLRQRYEVQLAEAQKTIQDMVSKARQDGERTRAELIATAKAESEKILEKGRKDLTGETDKLKEQLRSEVAGLSVSIAEKILKRSVDTKVQDDVLKESLKSLTGASS